MSEHQRKFSRREFLRVAALGGAGLALGACAPTVVKETVVVKETAAPPPAEAVHVKFMQGFQPGEGEYPYFDWAVKEYNGLQTKVVVDMMDTPRTDQATVVQAMSARGDPPDITIGGSIDFSVCRSGVLRSLDDFYKEPIGYGNAPTTPWGQVFNQALMEMQKVDGHDYGIPAEGAYTFVFYYNKDVFSKNGIEIPKTWTEMIKAGDKFKEIGVAPFPLAGVWPYYMHWWFFTLAQRTAGMNELQNAMFMDKAASWNTPDFLLAAEEIQKLRDNKYFVDGFQGLDHIGCHMEFLSGRAAMDYVGTWFTGEMKDSIPADFPLGSFKFPAYEGGKGDPTAAQLWANNYVIYSIKRIPESVDFLKFLSSSTAQDKQAEMLGTVSARSDAQCPPVQQGGCDNVAQAKEVAGYEFSIFMYEGKLEQKYQVCGTDFFFGKTDAAGYIAALDEAKKAYFAA